MTISREEIIDLALRYIPDNEIGDFPFTDELFCLLMREIPTDRVLKEEEGWTFGGYGICNGYSFDEDTKPRGKWLWMHFASLASFPPTPQVLKLQPPHVVNGRFQSTDRTHEIRIIKVNPKESAPEVKTNSTNNKNNDTTAGNKKTPTTDKKIVAFRKKNSS